MTPLKSWLLVAVVASLSQLPAAHAQLTTIHSFNSDTDGGSPTDAPLTVGSDGALYGTTPYDGPSKYGTVYRLTTTGDFLVLHAFTNGADGGRPFSGVTEGSPGVFYGSTAQGGDSNEDGIAFSVTPAGGFAIVHTFAEMPDGAAPGHVTFLLQPDGTLVGAAAIGGPGTLDSGKDINSTLFSLTPAGAVNTLYSFNPPEGTSPQSLIQAADGSFYGTTGAQGGNLAGNVFHFAGGTVTSLYSFPMANEFEDSSSIIQAADGSFYGTTSAGGANGNGTVFRILADGTVQPIHDFSALVSGNNAEGAMPIGGLVQALDGTFYGTASKGGDTGFGTIYKVDAATGAVTAAHSFQQDADGFYPKAPLINGPGGVLFGTTTSTPNNGVGTVFSFALKGVSSPGGGAPHVTLAVKGDGMAIVGSENGKILFTRDGDTSADLTVSYTAKGSAKNGVDYQQLSGTLTIPAGSASTKLKIKPFAAAPDKGSLKVTIALAASDSFAPGDVAKVKIKFINP